MNYNDEPKVLYECGFCGRKYTDKAACMNCIRMCKATQERREFTFCTEVTMGFYYSADDNKYHYELIHEQHPGYVYKDRPNSFESTATGDTLPLSAVSTFIRGLDHIRGFRYCYVTDKRIHSDAEIKKMLVEAAKKEFKKKYRRSYNRGRT